MNQPNKSQLSILRSLNLSKPLEREAYDNLLMAILMQQERDEWIEYDNYFKLDTVARKNFLDRINYLSAANCFKTLNIDLHVDNGREAFMLRNVPMWKNKKIESEIE